MTIGRFLDQQPDKLKGLQKILLMAFCISPFIYTPHYNGRKDIFAPYSVFSHFVCTLHFCAQMN